jgi:hypothetical protein
MQHFLKAGFFRFETTLQRAAAEPEGSACGVSIGLAIFQQLGQHAFQLHSDIVLFVQGLEVSIRLICQMSVHKNREA